MCGEEKWHSMAKTMETTAEFIFNHFDALILNTVYAQAVNQVAAGEALQDVVKCKRAAAALNTWYADKMSNAYYKYGYASENYVRLEKE